MRLWRINVMAGAVLAVIAFPGVRALADDGQDPPADSPAADVQTDEPTSQAKLTAEDELPLPPPREVYERQRRGLERGGPEDARLPHPPPLAGQPPIERLLGVIREHHPDLARRLYDVQQRSPEEFERLLADALAIRLRGALERLDETGDRPTRGERAERPGRDPLHLGPPGRPEDVPPPIRELDRETRELTNRNDEIQQRTLELVDEYGRLGESEEATEADRTALRDRLKSTINEHFEVRSELRRIELRRIEFELSHLGRMVDGLRQELKTRDELRESIIERRLRLLLGEAAEAQERAVESR